MNVIKIDLAITWTHLEKMKQQVESEGLPIKVNDLTTDAGNQFVEFCRTVQSTLKYYADHVVERNAVITKPREH
jgi:hypothetical protein